VQVQSVLSLDHPRFRKDGQPKFSVDDAIQVVENNDKQWFQLECCTLLEDGTLLKEDIVNGTTQNTASGDANQSKDHVEKNNTHHGKRVLCISANQGNLFCGTYKQISCIQHQGLSRMKRNHIHFTTGLPKSPNKPISGMRSSSEIYIYRNG
jgi:hypothetical protein